jgi:hypothetical protein
MYGYTYDSNSNSTSGYYKKCENSAWTPDLGQLLVYSKNNILFSVYGYRYVASFKALNSSSINDLFTTAGITIFPNPAKDLLTINLPTYDSISLNIYDLTGNLLFSKQAQSLQEHINISMMKSGMYVIEIKSGKVFQLQKIVIQH